MIDKDAELKLKKSQYDSEYVKREGVKERKLKTSAEHYQKNKEKVSIRSAIRYKAKKAAILINSKIDYSKNKDQRQQKKRAWKAINKHKLTLYRANRRAALLNATPRWANKFFIEEIYEIAKKRSDVTGVKWHVDHVIPLINKKVCGLHVESNLQVITSIENLKKFNTFIQE